MDEAHFIVWSASTLQGYDTSGKGDTFTRELFPQDSYFQVTDSRGQVYGGNNVSAVYVKDGANYGLVNYYLSVKVGVNVYNKVLNLMQLNTNTGEIVTAPFKIFTNYNYNFYTYLFVITEINEVNTFTFNKIFNYNAPLGANLGTPYAHLTNPNWVTEADSTSGFASLPTNNFYFEGTPYNRINSYFKRADGDGDIQVLSEDGKLLNVGDGAFVYEYMTYSFVENGTEIYSIIVNKRDVSSGVINNNDYYAYATTTTWINDVYRYLDFRPNNIFSGSTADTFLSYLYSYNNNNQYAGLNNGNDTNIFTLLATAFGAVASVLNITILPYLTIGTLLFLPLVVTVIVVIVHLLKK